MAEETLSPIPHIHEDEPLNGMGKDETSEPHETKIDSDKSPEEIEHRQDATLLSGTADDEIKIGAWRIYRPNTEFDGLFQSRIYFSVEASFEAMPGMHFRLNNKIISQEALQTIRAGLQISLCETKFSKKVCGDKYVLFGFCPERADRIVAFVCSVTTFQFSAVAFPCGWCYPLYENMEFFKEHQTQFKTSLVEYFAMEEKKRDSPLVVIRISQPNSGRLEILPNVHYRLLLLNFQLQLMTLFSSMEWTTVPRRKALELSNKVIK
jgi:hypothetical protein